jgi:hypothetical protein
MDISNDYVKAGKRMAELSHLKALWWKGFRSDYKSDVSAERSWDLAPEGEEMNTLRITMKGMEMKMSAIKTMLSVLEIESRNQY